MENVSGVTTELDYIGIDLSIMHGHYTVPKLIFKLICLHGYLGEWLRAALADVRLVVHHVLDAPYHN